MIHFVLGGFGDGKSYSGMRMLRNELINGTRPVVTNLAVKERDLAQYFHSHYLNCEVRLLQRLRILTDEETSSFFAHRVSKGGFHYDIPLPSEDEEKKGKRPDWTHLRDAGCLFIIEEAHEFFGAREWQKTGRSVLAYKNQNRKFGDDIILITPQLQEIEKAFRTCGQSYTTLTNLGNRKVHGMSLPGLFLAREYCKPPDNNAHPLNVYRYTLDKNLADCYDTARGVRGVQGVLADKGKRRRGIPWWLVLCVLSFIGVGYVVSPYILGKKIMFAGFVGPKQRVQSQLSQQETFSSGGKFSDKLGVAVQTAPETTRSASPSPDASLEALPPRLSSTGYAMLPDGTAMAFLSDGRTATSLDKEIQFVNKRLIIAFGKPFLIYPGRSVSQQTIADTGSSAGSYSAPSFDRPTPGVSVTYIGQRYNQHQNLRRNVGFSQQSTFASGQTGSQPDVNQQQSGPNY